VVTVAAVGLPAGSIEEALRICRRLDGAMAGRHGDFTPRGIPRAGSRRDDGRTFGRRRSAAAVQARACWPSWSCDLDSFIRRCEPCATYRRGAIPRRAELKPCLLGAPWESVFIDITGPHPPSSRQNGFILTCVDHFSKWAEAIPLANHTATVVARALMTHVFSRYGTPLQLLWDR